MAQISYEDVSSVNENEFSVGFFNLKTDGAEAIVRILCDSLADLDILTVHPVTIGQSSFPNRNVNCLRTPHDPLDKCPFCQRNEKFKQRVYIKMLQYDPQTRQPQAVVWDRPANVFVPMLKSYIENYGPLSKIMCKIIRHGSGLDTKYDIIPNLNPSKYTQAAYPIETEGFKDFNVLGRMVLDKSADEMNHYLMTGEFPEKERKAAANADWAPQPIQGGYTNPAPQGIPNGYRQPYQSQSDSTSPLSSPAPVETDPWGNAMDAGPAPMNFGESSMERPRRY